MGNNVSSSQTGVGASSPKANQLPLISLQEYTSLYSPIRRTKCDAPPGPPPPLPPPGAAADKSPASPPPPPPSEPAAASPEADAIAQAAANSSPYTNPGSYETLSMDAKRLVALDTFEGFRCDVNKQMSPSMVVVHSFGLAPSSGGGGSPMQGGPPPPPPSSYTFITQVGDDSGVFVSRVDTTRGGVDARVQRMLLGGLAMFKLQMSLSGSDNDTLLAEVDVGTMIPSFTWTANLKYGSMGGGPVWGANYWQAITPQLALGGEGMYIAAQGVPAAAYAFKYDFQAPLTPQEQQEVDAEKSKAASGPPPGHPGMPTPEAPGTSSLIGNYHSNGMATLNYRRVITPQRVTVGSELAFPLLAPFQEAPELLLGAEFNLTRSKLQWSLDCNTWKFNSVLETKLGMTPAAPRFTLSAAVDHFNQDFKFGYSINIDG